MTQIQRQGLSTVFYCHMLKTNSCSWFLWSYQFLIMGLQQPHKLIIFPDRENQTDTAFHRISQAINLCLKLRNYEK